MTTEGKISGSPLILHSEDSPAETLAEMVQRVREHLTETASPDIITCSAWSVDDRGEISDWHSQAVRADLPEAMAMRVESIAEGARHD